MKIDSSVELKRVHGKEIMDYLRKERRVTKKVMAEELNLSFATVSNICNEMREKGYIQEEAKEDTKVVGRTPKTISIQYENLLSLCLDLTRFGWIRVCVLDYGNQMVFDEKFAYEKDCDVEAIVNLCREIYEEQVLDTFQEWQIIGVGVAVPGIFEKKTHHIVSSEIEMFNNQPMKEMLSEALKKTVYVDNESNLCVLSEYMQKRHGQEQENLIYIFADEGLGIGVVANGNLICGSRGYAPEICHMPIGNPQMKCHLCGNYGCVESDLRIQGYVEKYRLYAGKELKSYGEFLNLIKEKDPEAGKVLTENGEIFGRLLSILNNMFNPDCILIGGGTTETLKICLQTSIEEMKTRMLVAEEDLPQIYLDEESSTTMVKGASEMVFSKWMPI